MGASRKHEQHRALRIRNDRAQPIRIVEQEGRPFVRGKAPAESDRQHVGRIGIAVAKQPIEMGLAAAIAEMLIADALPHRIQHPGLQILVHRPEHVLGDVVDVVERLVSMQTMTPIESKKTVEQIAPLERQKRRYVNAVRYVVDRIFFRWHFGPEALQHFGGQFPVDPGDAVVEP